MCLILAAMLAGVIALGRYLGWGWAGDIVASLVVWALLAFAGVWALAAWLDRRDGRQGLAVREWNAIQSLGDYAKSGDQRRFDRSSLSKTKRTDDAILIGYATILVHLQITDRFGPTPSDRQLDRLAAECVQRWRAVIRQQPGRLNMLLRQARDYQRDGLPHADWDNHRGMAAAAGVLRIPQLHPVSLRFRVADDYADFLAKPPLES